MAGPKAALNITEAQRTLLEHISRSRELLHSLSQGIQIVLLAAQGKDNKTISGEFDGFISVSRCSFELSEGSVTGSTGKINLLT